MKDLLNKVSSYNILNNLLPGGVFVFLLRRMTSFNLYDENAVIQLIICYFAGMIISRFGSVIVEPVLRKFVKFAEYPDYIKASKKDAKIEILLETNNTYRSFAALFVVLFLAELYEVLEKKLPVCENIRFFLIFIVLFLLFVISYIKQTKYIVNRVKEALKEDSVKK